MNLYEVTSVNKEKKSIWLLHSIGTGINMIVTLQGKKHLEGLALVEPVVPSSQHGGRVQNGQPGVENISMSQWTIYDCYTLLVQVRIADFMSSLPKDASTITCPTLWIKHSSLDSLLSS